MVNNGMSSLQKAAARSGSTSSLSKARGSNGKNRGTETSFEIGGAAPPRAPAVVTRDVKTQSAYTISGTSYTIGGDTGTSAIVGGGARKSNKKSAKSTQHFTIISSHDEQQRQQQDDSEFSMDVDHHHEIGHGSISMQGSMEMEYTVGMSAESSQPSAPPVAKTQTSFQIGGFQEERKYDNAVNIPSPYGDLIDDREVEQMEGVIDQGLKMPLVVLDGANVAYAYAKGKNSSSLEAASLGKKLEPDVLGIKIATDFFLEAGVRALVVLPQYWFREDDRNPASKLMILSDLKERGLIVASPPTDDDDAYALTISSREEMRSRKPPRNGEGPGFVLSNDLFRDAQERDAPNGILREWLTKGRNDEIGPGRISYTFGDMGSMNDRGEHVLDFVPNPRHPLIIWMESQNGEINHA